MAVVFVAVIALDYASSVAVEGADYYGWDSRLLAQGVPSDRGLPFVDFEIRVPI